MNCTLEKWAFIEIQQGFQRGLVIKLIGKEVTMKVAIRQKVA